MNQRKNNAQLDNFHECSHCGCKRITCKHCGKNWTPRNWNHIPVRCQRCNNDWRVPYPPGMKSKYLHVTTGTSRKITCVNTNALSTSLENSLGVLRTLLKKIAWITRPTL